MSVDRNSSPGRKTIALVCGARPNFVKIAPIYRALAGFPDWFHPVIIHTGQHYDERLSDVFFRDLGIPRPDVHLGVGSGTHAEQTARAMIGIEGYLLDCMPDMLVCVGDVNSTLAASVVASKCCVPCAHVEAGLRSGDRSMPEEINRIVADHTADVLYTTCQDANDNLTHEGIDPSRIAFVGNVMIDTLLTQMPRIEASDAPQRLGLTPGEYVLLTMHRPANVDNPQEAAKLLETIRLVAQMHPVVFPIHPRTRLALGRWAGSEEWSTAIGGERLLLCDPLGYIDFLALQKSARVVLTDSGGVQEETTILGVPCLTLRPNTERPVTITHGTNRLVGLNPIRIQKILGREPWGHQTADARPPLWDGKAAPRIVRHMAETVFGMEICDESMFDSLSTGIARHDRAEPVAVG